MLPEFCGELAELCCVILANGFCMPSLEGSGGGAGVVSTGAFEL